MDIDSVEKEQVVLTRKTRVSITLPIDKVEVEEVGGEIAVNFENKEAVFTFKTNGNPRGELQDLETKIQDAADAYRRGLGY